MRKEGIYLLSVFEKLAYWFTSLLAYQFISLQVPILRVRTR